MDYQTLLICILSSSLAAATVSSVKDLIIDKHKRKDKNDDNERVRDEKIAKCLLEEEELEKNLESLNQHLEDSRTLMKNIVESNKLLMRERIKSIATTHIKNEEITFEDRKLIHDMWDMYHTAWKGNGDLNLIIENIDELPLKIN